MKSRRFNALVADAHRNQPLPSYSRPGESRTRHKWKVTARRYKASVGTLTGRLWQLNVGTGCVNEQPAAIQYRIQGDPRGWEMPANYAPYLTVQGILGDAHPFVDRPLWDDPLPFILVTAPTADGSDPGGFFKVPDKRRPLAFRSAQDWNYELWQATVWITVGFWKADPALDLVRGKESTRLLQRWRVFAGQFPTESDNVRAGTAYELARVYLFRRPGKPEKDTLRIDQRVYWNLRARTVEPAFALGDAFAQSLELLNLAVLPIGAGGLALGVTMLATEAILTETLLSNLNNILESTGSTLFWSV